MEGVNSLFTSICFFISNILILWLLCIVFIAQQPFNLLQRLFMPSRPRRHRTKVHVTTVESQREGGDTTPRDTLLFIHGFPDGPPLWSSTIRRMTAAGYRCLVVSLPGCRGQAVDKPISPDSITDQLESALQGAGVNDSITVIGHDFGSIYALGLRRKFKNRVHRLVLLDVGISRNVHPVVMACYASYQLCFLMCYYIGHPLGTYALRLRLRSWNYNVRPLEEIQSDMAWFYAALPKYVLDEFRKERRKVVAESSTSRSEAVAAGDVDMPGENAAVSSSLDGLPLLFVYGKLKPFAFHDTQFEKKVRESPHGVVEALNCGHWLQRDKEREWFSVLLKWLDSSKSAVINN